MNEVNRMEYKLTHSSYYMDKMNDVLEWLQNRGYGANLSRYSRYKSYIDDFYNGNPDDLFDLEVRFKKQNEAIQECIQIVQVYEAFKDEDSKGFAERLAKAVNGTDFYDSEKKSDAARDFLYELLVAYWFKGWGYDIDFDQITDVVATRDGKTVYVECKRIKSIKALEENFKKACKQLSKVEDDTEHYGIVFIDVYNCLADKLKDYEYPNVLAMRHEVQTVLANDFGKPNNNLIHNILDKYVDSTLGVAFTVARCLWLSNVTPQFMIEKKVRTSGKISDENFEILNELLKK